MRITLARLAQSVLITSKPHSANEQKSPLTDHIVKTPPRSSRLSGQDLSPLQHPRLRLLRAGRVPGQHLLQIPPGPAGFVGGDVLRCADGDDLAAAVAALGAEV